MHRIIVVGRGLIGSAAARHLAKLTDGVAVIGPGEPADLRTHTGVFASHYDEGRITRIVDRQPDWAETARRSIARYAEIEAASGIKFFTPAGYLAIADNDRAYLDSSEANARHRGATVDRLDGDAIRTRYGFINVKDNTAGVLETGSAGYISPRALVDAQTEAARRAGAEIIDLEATAVRLNANAVEVETADGAVHKAERVLIATGAFTDSGTLVPVRFDLKVYGRTVVLAKIEDDLAAAFDGMPAMTHHESGSYILPPIRYPNGQRYLKLGVGTPEDIRLHTRDDVTAWFQGDGSPDDFREFKALMVDLFPPLARCTDWHSKSCATSFTPNGLPYIDTIDKAGRIAVAIGGNGKGAKSSDDWGWIAAHVALGVPWHHQVAPEDLALPASARLG